ncbi:MAG: glutathione S-transferase C-terminal domain-containing protein [Myxococcales bacterium]|nr:glutathione S-transferase C-terminal domain-containing protein [Myxococcales bacterium]
MAEFPESPEAHAALIAPGTSPPPAVAALWAAIRRAGAAVEQADYEAAYHEVFSALDAYEERLRHQRYLGGDRPDAEDWWLFAVLVRFDAAFHGFYKLNRQRLDDFSQLGPWLRDLFQSSAAVADGVDLRQIRAHYATESEGTNPKQLVPRGRGPDLRAPHDRWRFDAAVRAERGVQEDPSRPRAAGEWVRPPSGHRDWISADGSTGFAAEAGRYHLYVANNCPWSHRCALVRSLKGLQDVVSMDVLFYRRDPERGWQFRPEEPGCTPDTVNGARFVREIYESVGSAEKSVPVLWDRATGRIVNNESAEILRMLNGAFEPWTAGAPDLYPEAHRAEIDHLNAYIYTYVNNGAYKAGFTSSQEVYDTWFDHVFAALDWLDRRLTEREWLVGETLTEADVRLFPTIYRFDPVYFVRFRLDARRVSSYPGLSRWLQRMLEVPGVAEASNLEHCKRGYFGRTGNNLIPVGPA